MAPVSAARKLSRGGAPVDPRDQNDLRGQPTKSAGPPIRPAAGFLIKEAPAWPQPTQSGLRGRRGRAAEEVGVSDFAGVSVGVAVAMAVIGVSARSLLEPLSPWGVVRLRGRRRR